MTSRFPAWEDVESRPAMGPRTKSVLTATLPVQPVITGPMVDEAVERVLSRAPWTKDTSVVLADSMGRDSAGPVAQAYYAAQAAAARLAQAGVGRRDFTVPYVLEDADVAALTEYVPEYRLRFTNSEDHDHSMAAASRAIDRSIIVARLPRGQPVSDVGGDPLYHIKAKHTGVHVCGPDADVKDSMRHMLREMEATRLSVTAVDETVKGLAEAYLQKDISVRCNQMAQYCDFPAAVITSVHVYDVDMEEWPRVMERKGASLIEGCILFSSAFFEERVGVLGVSKARYEIDVEADTFKMGFDNSPSWWYEHKWSRYMLYGVDQVIVSSQGVYSYKVVERRGDTLFFRILKLQDADVPTVRSSAYRTPGVEVVRVRGFELNDGASWFSPSLKRKDYTFPLNLWKEMVSQAAEEFERGVMDYNKMYNHYRTISVRQTINATLVMGGERVSQKELVPLVVHACLAAAGQSLLGQRETRLLTTIEMERRNRRNEGLFKKVIGAFSAMAKSVFFSKLLPFRALGNLVRDFSYSYFEQWLLDWEPVCSVVVVEAKLLQTNTKHLHRRSIASADSLYESSAKTFAPADHYAALMKVSKLREIAERVCPQMHLGKVSVPNTPVKPDAASTIVTQSAAPTYHTVDESVQSVRKAAIREHIVEIEMQNRAVVSTCARVYTELCIRNTPNVQAIRNRAELYRNPDLWEVVNGTVVRSALGIEVRDFKYSAVYHPRVDAKSGDKLRSVTEHEFVGESEGEQVRRVSYVVGDSDFSGWVLVTDDLIIHNGPQVLSSLQRALDLPHDYSVVLHSAPPGSGKTYAIVHESRPTGQDVIMCPVRESINDTRDQVCKLHPAFPDPRLRIRTVDSYLVNLEVKKTAALKAHRLLADECYMAHAGKWYAAAALLGVSEVYAYGDDKQIPHIPRVQAPKLHVRIKAQHSVDNWTTRRCPPSAVAAWGSEYNWKVRSLNKVKDEGLIEVASTKGMEVPSGCVMMCMYQADKVTLRAMYARCGKKFKVLTAHEAEGKTFEHVWLHRFDGRKRNDNFSLFDQSPHVLVAMSRHTHSFLYSRPADLGDLVSSWIKRSKDPRRRAAAADMDSVGVNREYL